MGMVCYNHGYGLVWYSYEYGVIMVWYRYVLSQNYIYVSYKVKVRFPKDLLYSVFKD